MMISTFLDESYANPQNSIVIQNQLSRFMSDDSDANFNETLRKDLILRVQNQDLFLESLFELVLRPTKEFSKSFIQEKL
jgi:DNA-binding transcriptional regulator WhiA